MNEFHIGILGLANAGKTVLLTSLLNHLFHHDPEAFVLAPARNQGCPRTRITHPQETKASKAAGEARFPYESYRQRLLDRRGWPHKTRDLYRFSLRFSRSDWRFDATLHFLDFPGERFADGPMRGRDFAAWSDEMLRHLDARVEPAADFLALQRRDPPPGPDELVAAYRLCLARMVADYRPLVAPSTFFLDRAGAPLPADVSPERWAATRHAGLDEDHQFAPVSAALRERAPELAAAFAPSYLAYRTEVVDPLFREMARCDALAVLVDIPGILVNGVGALNDTATILSWIVEATQPRGRGQMDHWGRRLVNALVPRGWSLPNLRRLAFVAAKADLVRRDDQNRLKSLLEHTTRAVRNHVNPAVDARDFVCSAVVSTEWRDGDLHGSPIHGPDGQRGRADADPVALGTSSLGDFGEWPRQPWNPTAFHFPNVHPVLPAFMNAPPQQEGLDHLFNFLLGCE